MAVAETRAVHGRMQSCTGTIVAIYRYLHGTYRVACYRNLLYRSSYQGRCEQMRLVGTGTILGVQL